jgi:hypothetical protein
MIKMPVSAKVCILLCFNSLLFHLHVAGQCKTYRLSTNNDTINCTDTSSLKQGIWVLDFPALRGEPAYTEQGAYEDDLKVGTWYRFNAMGDIIAEENYRFGYKNGICSYYNLMGILRRESWKAIDPKNPYDTIKVFDLEDGSKYRWQIIRLEASTVKHGTWQYYDPQRNTIINTEEYVLDQLVVNKKKFQDSVSKDRQTGLDSVSTNNKPPEVLEYEKQNSKKKKIKVRDGSTGINRRRA